MGSLQTISGEGAILSRVVLPERADFAPALAKAILTLDFPAEDRQEMHELAAKARAGTLSLAEKEEVADYERVGSFLSLLQAKARRVLKNGS
jgi:hypothetical protein